MAIEARGNDLVRVMAPFTVPSMLTRKEIS
jgi:hypothetical protein